mgnify:CR=1 FL=1
MTAGLTYRFLWRALFAVLCASASVVAAQEVLEGADAPPAAYAHARFVAASGCAYFRVTSDQGDFWLPRLDAARRPICGLAPSLGGSAGGDSPQMPELTAARLEAPKVKTLPVKLRKMRLKNTRYTPKIPDGIKVPRGYQQVWQDGRLNPYRGLLTTKPAP